jgi:hypothetical protein
MTRLRALREPEEVDVAVSSSSSQDAGGRPEWMQQLGASCTQQLGALPKVSLILNDIDLACC